MDVDSKVTREVVVRPANEPEPEAVELLAEVGDDRCDEPATDSRGLLCPTFLGNPMMNMELLAIFQVLMAHRADALLLLDELSATKHRHLGFRSSLLPVVL